MLFRSVGCAPPPGRSPRSPRRLLQERRLLTDSEHARAALLPFVEEAEDLDGGPGYPIITGDYDAFPAWASTPVTVGTSIGKPTPVFTKLDPEVVVETERAAMAEGN